MSDGVFAFAMTFLAVTLILPQTSGARSTPSLFAFLGHSESAFVGYILSFFVIASWWGVHHRLFSSILRYDQLTVRMNSFFLLVISVTPFLVALLFDYGPSGFERGSASAQLAVALYGAVQALGGLVLVGIWRHATQNRRLVSPSLPEEWIRATEDHQWLTVGVFAASVGIAFLSPLLAELTWVVMIFGVRQRLWRRRQRTLTRTSPASR